MATSRKKMKSRTGLLDQLVGNAREIVRVNNEAMAPLFNCGEILFLERLPNADVIIWGMPYIVVLKTSDLLIRRVFFEQAFPTRFLLASEKADLYPNKSIREVDIESIYRIVSVFTPITERIEPL